MYCTCHVYVHDSILLCYYIQCTGSLTTADLATLQNALYEVRDVWYHLGVQLNVPLSDLRAIKAEYRDKPGDCLLEMLSVWLSITTPSPTWQTVVDALCCPAIGIQKVAENIQRTYCKQDRGTHVLKCFASTLSTLVRRRTMYVYIHYRNRMLYMYIQ